MRNHKLIGWVVGIPLLVILLILVIVFQEPDKEGISRAMAAKSVALALQSPDELKTWQKEYKTSFFPAETQKQWYVPYLDYLYGEGLLDVSEIPADEKQALQELTYREAAEMMGKLAPSLERLVRADKKNAADRPEDGGGVYTGMVKEPFILIREQAIHEFIRQAIRRRETPLPVRCDTCA